MSEDSQRVALLGDLAAVIDGDPIAQRRHEMLLAQSQPVRALCDEVAGLAEALGDAGHDFRPSIAFEEDLALALIQIERRRSGLGEVSADSTVVDREPTEHTLVRPMAPSIPPLASTPDPEQEAGQPPIEVLRLDEAPSRPSTPQVSNEEIRSVQARARKRPRWLWASVALLAVFGAGGGAVLLSAATSGSGLSQLQGLHTRAMAALAKLKWQDPQESTSQSASVLPAAAAAEGSEAPVTLSLATLPPTEATGNAETPLPGLTLERLSKVELRLRKPPRPDAGPELAQGSRLKTDNRTVAQLSTPHVQLRLGRNSRLTRPAKANRQLHLQGDLRVHAPPTADMSAAWSIRTRQALIIVDSGLLAIHAGPLETRVAVLAGRIRVEPHQHPARELNAGELLRIPQRGTVTTKAIRDGRALTLPFVNPGNRGTLGRLRALTGPVWAALLADGHTNRRAQRTRSVYPDSHRVQLSLTSDQVLVEVTERFPSAARPELTSYELPLPPGATLLESRLLPDHNSTPPPGPAETLARRLGHGPDAPIHQLARLFPVTVDDAPVQITTRYLQPILWDGTRYYFRYRVEPPRSRAASLSFEGEAELQEPGTLNSEAPFAKADKGKRNLKAKAAVPPNGLEWSIYLRPKAPLAEDGQVHYAALAPATPPPLQAVTGSERRAQDDLSGPAQGTLYVMPALPRSPRPNQHWVIVVDRSYSMHGLALQLVPEVLQTMVNAALPEDRFSVLGCELHCESLSDTPLAPTDAAFDSLWAKLSAIQTGGGFDLGHALTEASALSSRDDPLGQSHIVVFTNHGGSVGVLKPERILGLSDNPPRVSVVHLAASLEPREGLAELARAFGGQPLTVDSTASARQQGFELVRPDHALMLDRPTLTVVREGRILGTQPLPNLGLDHVQRVYLAPRKQPVDQAVLSGHLAGMPFEKLYPLPAPGPALAVTPQSLWWQASQRTAPDQPAFALPADATPDGAMALASYDRTHKTQHATDELLDLSREPAAELPTQEGKLALERVRKRLQSTPHDRVALFQYLALTCRWGSAKDCLELAQSPLLPARERLKHVPVALLRLGRQEAAVDALTHLADVMPADAATQTQVGQLQWALGRPERACAHLQRAADLSPGTTAQARSNACWDTLRQPLATDSSGGGLENEPRPAKSSPAEAPTQATGLYIRAQWQGSDDYDLLLHDQAGRTWSLLDGPDIVESAFAESHEELHLPEIAAGVYTLELLARRRHDAGAPPVGQAPKRPNQENAPDAVQLNITLREAALSMHVTPQHTRNTVARFIVRPHSTPTPAKKARAHARRGRRRPRR